MSDERTPPFQPPSNFNIYLNTVRSSETSKQTYYPTKADLLVWIREIEIVTNSCLKVCTKAEWRIQGDQQSYLHVSKFVMLTLYVRVTMCFVVCFVLCICDLWCVFCAVLCVTCSVLCVVFCVVWRDLWCVFCVVCSMLCVMWRVVCYSLCDLWCVFCFVCNVLSVLCNVLGVTCCVLLVVWHVFCVVCCVTWCVLCVMWFVLCDVCVFCGACYVLCVLCCVICDVFCVVLSGMSRFVRIDSFRHWTHKLKQRNSEIKLSNNFWSFRCRTFDMTIQEWEQ
jgi:hypothetical protein